MLDPKSMLKKAVRPLRRSLTRAEMRPSEREWRFGSRSKYDPHQGKGEIARRKARMERKA